MGEKLGAAVYKTHLQVLHFKPRNSSCEKGTHTPNTGAQTEGYTGCLSPLSHAHTAGAAPLDAFLHGIEPEASEQGRRKSPNICVSFDKRTLTLR